MEPQAHPPTQNVKRAGRIFEPHRRYPPQQNGQAQTKPVEWHSRRQRNHPRSRMPGAYRPPFVTVPAYLVQSVQQRQIIMQPQAASGSAGGLRKSSRAKTGSCRSLAWTRIFSESLSVPQFDVHCPLLSAPLALKTTLQTIPASVPTAGEDRALAESEKENPG